MSNFFYDSEKLLTLMNNFNIITGIKIVVFDQEMKTIAAVPYEDCAFCSKLAQVPEARKKCHISTVEGCLLCKAQKGLYIYKCHAGLIEAVTPIFIGDIIVGYMMLGQVFENNDNTEISNEIINYASKYIGEQAKLHFEKLVSKSEAEIIAASQIMGSCVCDLLMNNAIREEKGKLIFEIIHYIESHLSCNLTVNDLCEKFKISRNTLYRMADTYLGMPIAEYIRKKRIKKAEDLIKSGMSVTLVAEHLGFCDYGYFGKVFKSVSGKTPSEVKKSR